MRVSSNKILQKYAQPKSHDVVTLLSAQTFPTQIFRKLLTIIYKGARGLAYEISPMYRGSLSPSCRVLGARLDGRRLAPHRLPTSAQG